MNSRQAKALRKARTAFITEQKPSMAKGPRAIEAADKLCELIRFVWPRLSHVGRGVVGHYLEQGNLQKAAAKCVS